MYSIIIPFNQFTHMINICVSSYISLTCHPNDMLPVHSQIATNAHSLVTLDSVALWHVYQKMTSIYPTNSKTSKLN